MQKFFYVRLALALCLTLGFLQVGSASAQNLVAQSVSAQDDRGQTVSLPSKAMRIVSLAPHVTETLFAIGAGSRIVGAVDYSDHPEAAKAISRIGSHSALDLERILALKPDLIVWWHGGNGQRQLERLLSLGIPSFATVPNTLDALPRSMRALARLTATQSEGEAAARRFEAQLLSLRTRYAGRATVSVFYQVWEKPLMTLNRSHVITEIMTLCGGAPVLNDGAALAPTVAMEAVIAADPEVIMSGGTPETLRAFWRDWPRMRAVKNGHLIALDGNLINRYGPRLAEGAHSLCEALDRVRSARGVSTSGTASPGAASSSGPPTPR
jgi:iron complex transport system substrate-binding protein